MHVALVGAEFEENLAVRYLWGALERDGHRVTPIVFNSVGQRFSAAQRLADSGAEVAGFSMVFTYRAREFAELAVLARRLGFEGHLVAGGHFAAFNAEQLLRDVPAFDSVACGEGEAILCQLVGRLNELEAVDGLVWRDGQRIVRNRPALKPSELDALAFPPRKQPFDDYLDIPITNLLSSRGCHYACSFCSIAAWHRLCGGARLRLRAPECVAEEMATLYRRGVRIFNFHDDNFFLPKRAERLARIRALRDELEQRGVTGIAFAVKSRPDTVDEQVFSLLKAMGMFRVFLGIEAGSAESLRQLGRKQTLEDNERALDVVNRLDLHACFNLLLLNPASTLEDFAANVAFLRRHPRNPMNFCRTEIYAGTPLERRLREQGRLLGDYWGYDYRFDDPRVQAAFEIIVPCFEQRNYGDEGLHHLTMQVDYEHQLLAHFFGSRDELRRRVKQYIVAVNQNTADHLDGLIDTVARSLPAERERELLAQRLRARIDADDGELGANAQQLLDEIRRTAREPALRSPRWVRKAAAAGLAASLSLSAAACKETPTYPTEKIAPPPTKPEDTHPRERIPAPPPPAPDAGAEQVWIVVDLDAGAPAPEPTHVREMAPAPPPPPPPPPLNPDDYELGPSSLLARALIRQALRIVSRHVRPAQDVELELWFDAQGRVARIALRGHDLQHPAVQGAGAELGALTTSAPGTRQRRFILRFSAAELRRGQPTPPTQPHEAAPHPPDTHPAERAPAPPRPPTQPREMAPRPTPPVPHGAQQGVDAEQDPEPSESDD